MRVLLVDDEPMVTRALVRAMRISNYECHAAQTCREAIDMMDAIKPDVVVTDYDLSPNYTGYDVGAAAQARGIPWFFYTGNPDIEGENVLQKPVATETLLQKIREVTKRG